MKNDARLLVVTKVIYIKAWMCATHHWGGVVEQQDSS